MRSTRARRPVRTMDAIIKLGERLKNLKPQMKEAGFGGEGTGAPPYEPQHEVEEHQFYNGPTCPICGQVRCPSGPPGCVGGRSLSTKRTENLYHSISAMPAYKGKSFEELRLQDLTRKT